jgi:hypothetical protein
MRLTSRWGWGPGYWAAGSIFFVKTLPKLGFKGKLKVSGLIHRYGLQMTNSEAPHMFGSPPKEVLGFWKELLVSDFHS